MINEIKNVITKQAESLFSSTFEKYMTGSETARCIWPLTQREPEMPQELIDMLD